MSIIKNETSHRAILASQPVMVLYCLPIAATILNRSERSPSELGRNISKFASRKEYDSVRQAVFDAKAKKQEEQ